MAAVLSHSPDGALSSARARLAGLFGKLGPRRPEVSRYRFFMAIVFVAIVSADVFSAATAYAGFVGVFGVVVWCLTLAGSFGVGPMRVVQEAISNTVSD